MVTIFTQSYRDSGLEGLVPMGVVFVKDWICEGKAGAIEAMRKQLTDKGIQFVFNCHFEFSYWGHPDNGKYTCEMMGDAYRLPSGQDDVFISRGPQEISRRRCGLVELEPEE